MIEKANSKSSVGRIAGLAREIRDYHLGSPLVDDAILSQIMSRLIPKVDNLISAMERTKIKSQLFDLDRARNKKIRDFKFLNDGYLHYPDPTIKENAVAVSKIFDKYGLEMQYADYLTESSLLESMFGDFSTPEASTVIAALPGIAECLADIESAQQAFDDFQLKYAKSNAHLKSKETATACKRQVTNAINNELVNFLRSAVYWGKSTYGNYANTIAEMTKKSNAIVRGENHEEEDTED